MRNDGSIVLAPEIWGAEPSYSFRPPSVSPVQKGIASVFVATSRADGGIERHSVQMAAELGRRGIPPLFVCRPGGAVEQACRIAGIPTIPLCPRNSGDLHAALRFASLLLAHKIDIVHAHSRRDFLPALFAVVLARRRGLPHVRLVLHAHMVRSLGTPPAVSARLFAKYADRVVCVSDAVRDFLLKEGQIPPSKVSTLHNGVDISRFASAGTGQARTWRREFRHEWGISSDAVVLTMVGRLDAKGQAILIDALPLLSVRFPMLRVVLVGMDGLAGEQERRSAHARRLNVVDKIVFTGPRDDVPRVLAASDILVHLPTDEAFGLALAEAMAAGLPTVTARTGGCAEVVQDGLTGFVVPPGDPGALTAALEPLLCGEQGKCLRIQMGAAGRAAAEESFSLRRQIDAVQEIYSALCPVPSD